MIEFHYSPGSMLANTTMEDGTVLAVHYHPTEDEYHILLAAMQRIHEL